MADPGGREPARILIRGCAVVTMDAQLGDFERANILIDDGRIAAVGPNVESEDALVIDAPDMIAIPGLADTHRHTWQTALRGMLADGTIPDYLRGVRLQAAPLYRPEDMYAGNYVGALDAINSGITTLVDYCHNIVTPDHAHAAVSGLLDAGIRGLYGHGLTPVVSNTWAQGDSDRQETGDAGDLSVRAGLAREIKSTYFSSDDQRLRFGIAPQELAIAPISEVGKEFALARDLGARMTMHANQVMVRQLFKDVEVLDGAGLLGPDLLLVHCSFNTPEEWLALRSAGVFVSICSESEMQMGMGFPAIREANEYTNGASLGIDCVPGDSGDMLSHARLALQVTRWRGDAEGYERMIAPQSMTWRTRDALEWITVNGSAAAGSPELTGSLSVGKAADVVLVNMAGVSTLGWNRRDPAGAVISQANSGNVDTVIIDGQIMKHRGELTRAHLATARLLLDESQGYLVDQMDARGGFLPQPPIDIPLYRERA